MSGWVAEWVGGQARDHVSEGINEGGRELVRE